MTIVYCGTCKQVAKLKLVDTGIGAYECHGVRGNDRQLSAVSKCCEDSVYLDEACTQEAESLELYNDEREALREDYAILRKELTDDY
jgi:hypothetical protein